jgi:hypothetical protein
MHTTRSKSSLEGMTEKVDFTMKKAKLQAKLNKARDKCYLGYCTVRTIPASNYIFKNGFRRITVKNKFPS